VPIFRRLHGRVVSRPTLSAGLVLPGPGNLSAPERIQPRSAAACCMVYARSSVMEVDLLRPGAT